MKKTARGFTLVEILIVISIISILTAMSAVALTGARASARDAERKGGLEDIKSALEIYRADCGKYPTSASPITLAPNVLNTNILTGYEPACSGRVYMSKVPADPQETNNSYTYRYRRVSDTSYELCAYLEHASSSTSTCTVLGTVLDCNTSGTTTNCNYSIINP